MAKLRALDFRWDAIPSKPVLLVPLLLMMMMMMMMTMTMDADENGNNMENGENRESSLEFVTHSGVRFCWLRARSARQPIWRHSQGSFIHITFLFAFSYLHDIYLCFFSHSFYTVRSALQCDGGYNSVLAFEATTSSTIIRILVHMLRDPVQFESSV